MATDLWGRDVGDLDVGETARQMKGSVASARQPVEAPETDARLDKLYQAVNDMARKADANAAAQLEETRKYVKAILDFRSGQAQRNEASQTKSLEKIEDATTKIWNASQNHGTFLAGISKLSSEAKKDFAEAIRMAGCCGAAKQIVSKNQTHNTVGHGIAKDLVNSVQRALRTRSGGGSGGSGGGGNASASSDDGGGIGKPGKWAAVMGTLKAVVHGFQVVHKKLVDALDIEPISRIFHGSIKEANNFRESIRAIAHETQGFATMNGKMEKEFSAITREVDASGLRRAEFQKIYLKNLERGFRINQADLKVSQKEKTLGLQANRLTQLQNRGMKSIQTTAAHTATQLHMNAEALNELFMDWHMHLGMSSLELGEIGRQMQSVARTSGVTGAQLEKAMKNTDSIVRQMANAGSATTDAVKNVTEIITLAEKYGAGEKATEMLGMTTDRRSFLNADPKSRIFMMNAANRAGMDIQSKLQLGTLRDKDDFGRLGQGQQKFVADLLKQSEGMLRKAGALAPGQSVNDIDQSRLGKDVIQKLQALGPEGSAVAASIQGKLANMNMTIGDVEKTTLMWREMSMKSGERIQSMLDERLALEKNGYTDSTEMVELNKKIMEAQAAQSMDAFGRLSEFSTRIAGAGGRIEGNLKNDIQKSLEQTMGSKAASEFMGNMSGNANELLKNLDVRAKARGLNLDTMLKSRGVQSRGAALTGLQSGDAHILQAIQQTLQETAKAERVAQDPITEIRDYLNQINNKLGSYVTDWSAMVPPSLAKAIFALGSIGSTLASIFVAVGALRSMASIGSAAKGFLFGGGGGGNAAASMMGYGGGGAASMGLPMAAAASLNRPSTMRNASRGSRIANANNYLASRKARGMSGKVPMMGATGRRFNTGRGWRGMLGRGLGFLSRNQDTIMTLGGAAAAGYGGYKASDGDLTTTALSAAGGGLAGYGTSRMLKGGGLDAANGMSGMPGFGKDCVPVCIVGGLENLASGGMGMFGGGNTVADKAITALNTVDMVGDVASVAETGSNALKAGRVAQFMSKVPGYTKAASYVSGLTSKASALPGVARMGSLAKGGNAILGKAAGPLSLALGGLTGYMEAEEAGMGKAEGTLYGALTGGAVKGSFLSDTLGVQKGSATDELMGIGGSAAYGALTGAAIGSIIPGVGTAVGAGVGAVIGAGAELVKVFTAEESGLRDAVTSFGTEMYDAASGYASSFMETASSVGGSVIEGAQSIGSTLWEGAQGILGSDLGKIALGSLTPMGLGAFAFGQSKDAADENMWSDISKMSYWFSEMASKGVVAGSASALASALTKETSNKAVGSAMNAGLFDNSQSSDAQDSSITQIASKDLNNIVSHAIETKEAMKSQQNIVAEVSRALDYERSASDAAESMISTNMLDYREEMKGEVGTLGYNRSAIETRIEANKYGEMSSGSGHPSMEAIIDYLTTVQRHTMQEMVEQLVAIKNNTAPQAGIRTVGKSSAGVSPPTRPGVKNIARDMTRGHWELAFSDSTPGAVNNEGRGGSA